MKLMALRYAGNCTTCGTRVEQGVQAWYDPTTKVTCTSCRPVDAQLSVDTSVEAPPARPTPKRSARTDLEKGAELEQKIASAFAAHDYRVQTNVVREGRSGSTHEVDVLAEKTDDLLTLSVAIECKAWASPIEKDVIAKFNEVRRDLGFGHALVVSLNGARPGAATLAEELGVVVWGPDEIGPLMGTTELLGLQNRPMVEEVGFTRRLKADDAHQLVEKEAKGTLGIGKETVVAAGDAWIPVAVVPLTLMEQGIIRRKTATTQTWAIYDLIGGTFVTRLDAEPERTPVQLDGSRLEPLLKLGEPAKRLDKVVASYEKATRDDTIKKYRGQMNDLGIPEFQVPTTGTPSFFLYPVHLAVAQKSNGSERVIAVDAFRSRPDADLGHELSKTISVVRDMLSAE